MRQLTILTICLMISSCGISMSSEEFFRTLSVKEIPDMSMDTVRYYTSFIEDDIPSLGKVSEPLLGYSIKYDTLARYRVAVIGSIKFAEQNDDTMQYARIDSIGIISFYLWNDHSQHREYYSNKRNGTDINSQEKGRTLEKCPLPKRILKRIRKDFFIRMKYREYQIDNINNKAISVIYDYRLY